MGTNPPVLSQPPKFIGTNSPGPSQVADWVAQNRWYFQVWQWLSGMGIIGALLQLGTSGAIAPQSGNYVITKAGVFAGTLAAPTPTVQDGLVIRIVSSTAFAHTITTAGLLQTGSAAVNTATFAAFAGAGVTLMAYNGFWIVLYSVGVTFS